MQLLSLRLTTLTHTVITMKRTALLLSLAVALIGGVATPSTAQSLSDLDGNAFLGHPSTHQFLGSISSNRYDSDSICNRYGNYGSKYSALSVLNRYANYGSQYSDVSAYNLRAEEPPILYLNNNEPIAVVSVSPKWGENGIHPGVLFGVICGQQ